MEKTTRKKIGKIYVITNCQKNKWLIGKICTYIGRANKKLILVLVNGFVFYLSPGDIEELSSPQFYALQCKN
jgi:hypothetical protein